MQPRCGSIIGPGFKASHFSGQITAKLSVKKILIFTGPETDRNELLVAQYGVTSTDNNAEAVKNADLVCYRQAAGFKMVPTLSAARSPGRPVISIVAVITMDTLDLGLDTSWSLAPCPIPLHASPWVSRMDG